MMQYTADWIVPIVLCLLRLIAMDCLSLNFRRRIHLDRSIAGVMVMVCLSKCVWCVRWWSIIAVTGERRPDYCTLYRNSSYCFVQWSQCFYCKWFQLLLVFEMSLEKVIFDYINIDWHLLMMFDNWKWMEGICFGRIWKSLRKIFFDFHKRSR